MEYVICNLCGSGKYRAAYKKPDVLYHPQEWFTVVECESCGLGYTNPRPAADEMARYYPANFFDYFERQAAFHGKRYAREARLLNLAYPHRDEAPRLLDVGCANGGFGKVAKPLGWRVEGLEVAGNVAPCEDFTVHRCTLPQLDMPAGTYDAITAWAVLEHVHDPMSYFIKAGKLLKKGGVFIFLVTNFESVSSRYLFREDVPRHLYFFTNSTVAAYLNNAGLKLEKTFSNNRIYEMRPIHWLRYFARRWLGRPPLTWEDLPETLSAYLLRKGLNRSFKNTLAYAVQTLLKHPYMAIDLALMPLYERVQMLRGSYGVVTYVARKL